MVQPTHQSRREPQPSWRNPKTLTALAVIPVALSVLNMLNSRLTWVAFGDDTGLTWSLGDTLVWGLPDIPFALGVWILSARFRIDRANVRRNLFLHFCFAFIVTNLRTGALVLSAWLIDYQVSFETESAVATLDLPSTLAFISRATFLRFYLSYWGIVALFHALHLHSLSEERLRTAAQLQTSLVEARLEALRCQLNPHFLFNTLNSISVLALMGNSEKVADMIERLSRLLRTALDDTRPESIMLTEELKFADGYLEIEQLRFGERLTVCREIAPDTEDALVPAMILQPIMENAVKHGVAAMPGAGSITIRAGRENGVLRLQVIDTGPGFAPSTRRGRGLTITQTRLEQLYGSAQKFEIGPSPSGGTNVTISIPFDLRSSPGPLPYWLS